MYCPIGFVNASERGTAVTAASILLKPTGYAGYFYFEWAAFVRRQSDFKMVEEETARPLSIPARSAQSKMVWYVWRINSTPPVDVEPGRYDFIVLIWTKVARRPQIISRHFVDVSVAMSRKLKENRAAGVPTTVSTTIDDALPENSFLSVLEASKLLEK
jgi:hypothetical protein